MPTGIRKQDIRAAAIGAGAGLAIFAALSFIHNQPASKLQPADFPASSLQDVPGTRMPDGTVHAGVSPKTGMPMYTTPKDAPLTYSFDQAQTYCAGLDAHGHKDWRVPSWAGLNVLIENRAAIGNFDTSASGPAGWYWSSLRYVHSYAWSQRFSDGAQGLTIRRSRSALRCVRG